MTEKFGKNKKNWKSNACEKINLEFNSMEDKYGLFFLEGNQNVFHLFNLEICIVIYDVFILLRLSLIKKR